MIVELLLIIVMVIIAGGTRADPSRLVRADVLGGSGGRHSCASVAQLVRLQTGSAVNSQVMLSAVLILFGGALLRISLVQAGQIQ
jgi:hypothetical protein